MVKLGVLKEEWRGKGREVWYDDGIWQFVLGVDAILDEGERVLLVRLDTDNNVVRE